MSSISVSTARVEPPSPGWGLRLAFDAAWPLFTPNLESLVVHVYRDADTLAEALDLAWRGVAPHAVRIPQMPLPPEAAALALLMTSFIDSPVVIELFIQQVFACLAGEVEAGRLRLSAIHPDTHRRFAPDAGVLRKPIAPADRVTNRVIREDGRVLADVRFYAAASATTDERSEPLPPPKPTADTAVPAPGETNPQTEPQPQVKQDLQALYDARVTSEYAPTWNEDCAWASKQGITRRRMQELRNNNKDKRLHTRHRR